MSMTTAKTATPLRKRKDSVAEILLMKHLEEVGITFYWREFLFASPRRWRFDFAFHHAGKNIAIEIEGGNYGTYDRVGRFQRGKQGGHHRPAGFEEDICKYNEAARLGWTVIRFTPNMIESGESKAFLAELFGTQAPWPSDAAERESKDGN